MRAQGMYAAGFLAYEAAPAFDPALRRQADGDVSPAVVRAVRARLTTDLDERRNRPKPCCGRSQTLGAVDIGRALPAVFDALQELIRNGETYQVNYTYRLRARLQSDPCALFLQLAVAQSPPMAHTSTPANG